MEKKDKTEATVPLRKRFALQKWEVGLIIGVVLFVWGWVNWFGSRASEGLLRRPLRVGIVEWPGYAGGLVANKGLQPNKDSSFWEHQLLVEFVLEPDEEKLRRMFKDGGEKDGVDIMWSTVDSLAQQLPTFEKNGVHPRAFMQVDWSRGADAIVATRGIGQLEDLSAEKIRIAVSNSASLYLLAHSLETSSMPEKDKQRIIRQSRDKTVGSKEACDRFVSGEADVAVLWEPYVQKAINQREDGAHILFSTQVADGLIADVMIAKAEFIEEKRDVIKAFIKGWFDGTTKAINDPMLAVKALQEEPEFASLTEEETHKLLGKAPYATLRDNVEMFAPSPLNGKVYFDELFDRASSIWVKRGLVMHPAAAEQAREGKAVLDIDSTQSDPICGLEIMKRSLIVAFPPVKNPADRAELGEEAQQILESEEISLLLRTHSGARFCVEVGAVPGDNPQLATAISRARENAIIEYLVGHYNHPRSHFMPAKDGMATGRKVSQNIRLQFNSASMIGNGKTGAH